MTSLLTENQLYRLNQSAPVQKLLDQEARIEANEREAERLAQNEADYQRSAKIGQERLCWEWEAHGRQHQRTGRLCLSGAVIKDSDRLSIHVGRKPTTVTVRYIYSGELKTIRACYGDTVSGESHRLVEGMWARRIEPAPAPESDEWHLKHLVGGKWAVVKPGCFAGSFSDLSQAQQLAEMLKSFDAIKPDTQTIHYRQV